MTHWRDKRESEPDRSEVFEALSAMLFYVVMASPFLAVWLGVVVWRSWQ